MIEIKWEGEYYYTLCVIDNMIVQKELSPVASSLTFSIVLTSVIFISIFYIEHPNQENFNRCFKYVVK